jgi:hypothetical protein
MLLFLLFFLFIFLYMISYICVLDFEATCWDNNQIDKSKVEIIEFPIKIYFSFLSYKK